MKIIKARPPNFEAIAKVFPGAHGHGVIFSYGDIIYAPFTDAISPALLAHEEVHGARQREMGVEAWWNQYLKSDPFRYQEELMAHRVEYRKILETEARHVRRAALRVIGLKLSSPLYGGMVSLSRAMRDIEA